MNRRDRPTVETRFWRAAYARKDGNFGAITFTLTEPASVLVDEDLWGKMQRAVMEEAGPVLLIALTPCSQEVQGDLPDSFDFGGNTYTWGKQSDRA